MCMCILFNDMCVCMYVVKNAKKKLITEFSYTIIKCIKYKFLAEIAS